jgi:hypothetical protein
MVQTCRMDLVAAAMSADARSITGRAALTGPPMVDQSIFPLLVCTQPVTLLPLPVYAHNDHLGIL